VQKCITLPVRAHGLAECSAKMHYMADPYA